MLSKTIIVLWSIICVVVLYMVFTDPTHQVTDVVTQMFVHLLVWSAVVIPVALIGILFKRI
jgi:hypothetical protein